MTAQMHRRVRPVQVESSACYCVADVGLNVIDAKKFVPGTRHCVQPEIKPTVHPTKRKSNKGEKTREPTPLIPGLPDDLAIACLIRVPRFFHRNLRLVCKRWQRLLASNFFYSSRKNVGIAEEWVYVIKQDRDGRVSWHAFDPRYQSWHPLPPIPSDFSESLGFGCAVLSGCHLYLFGGKNPLKGSMRRVVYYSARTNKWHRAPDMLRRRHYFGACVFNNCLYVAGGECEGSHHSLKSAEMYDPNKCKWSFISDMGAPMVPLVGVVYGDKWFLKGLGSHRQELCEMYIPSSNQWSSVVGGMINGWQTPCGTLNGQLYALDCRDGCRMRVYDTGNDSWDKLIDSKLHLGNSHALEAAALVPLGGKLCIVRNNMSISLVDVANFDCNGKKAQLWETLAGKGQIKTFVTNLWSNIAGKNGTKSQILHCQVLQA
eukprot:TRINITY_DN12848_c0_g1_i1.p1 TRINITY_DN12848_c0_g1~~TRINITY_DN12848_c0_g1_i1.p1  ORF type:complete len:430 (-),score=64.97 TRINITY_DN12848_c0_g1_i1:548-1837(-)